MILGFLFIFLHQKLLSYDKVAIFKIFTSFQQKFTILVQRLGVFNSKVAFVYHIIYIMQMNLKIAIVILWQQFLILWQK